MTNTNCGTFLIDKTFLTTEVPDYKQRVKTTNTIKVRNINDVLLNSTKHMSLNFSILDKAINESTIIACFTRHVYIINDLKVKLLIINDIIESKQIILDIKKKKLIIKNCQNMIVILIVKNVDSFVKRVARFSEITKISIKFKTIIAFKLREKKLSIERDFMFVSSKIDRLKAKDDIFSYIIDANIVVVLIYNANLKNVFFLKNSKLSVIQEYKKEECFLINDEKASLTINFDNHKSTSRN